MTDAQVSHWNRHAQRWRDIGPPLRPGAEDITFLREALSRWRSPSRAASMGLLLGVTPEIAAIEWQPALRLLAVDHSRAMIEEAWPGKTAARWAVCGDWFDLPVGPASIDIALGDGCFNAIEYPAGHRRLARSVARALRSGGLLALRLFCRPEPSEAIDTVMGELVAGRIGNFHVLKWRLAMAVQGDDASGGVRLGTLWDVYSRNAPAVEAVAARKGWPPAHVSTIHSYRGSDGIYTFPTVDEALAILSADFDCVEQWRGSYELGERCPHLLLRRR
jgi:SAM-dependent methyltransferase